MNAKLRIKFLLIAFVLSAGLVVADAVAAEIVISSLDEFGRMQQVPRSKLVDDEIVALDLFEQKNPPTEIYLLAGGRPYTLHIPQLGNEYSTTMVLRYPDNWELRWYTAESRKFYHVRRLSNAGAEPVTELVTKSAVHRMPPLGSSDGTRTIVGGVEYAFTYLTPQGGWRVLINNPHPKREVPADILRKYLNCEAVFGALLESKEPWKVTYTYPRRLQVEHLFADPRQPAKQLLVKDNKAYVAIAKNAQTQDPDQWFVLENGELRQASDPLASAPEKPPEIRHTRLSADGKWLAGNLKSDGTLICRNRVEEKGIAIPDEVARLHGTPLYFLESHQAFVIGVVQTPVVPDRADRPYFELFAFLPGKEELVNLGKLSATLAFDPKVWQQHMPEKLQAVAKSTEEVWMSAPAGKATQFGKYNTKTLEWVHTQYIPDVQFSPRDFFVDEQAKKLYFREDDQLLATALPASFFE